MLSIEGENGQNFYVHLGNRSFTSSSSGHVTISLLKDSTYDLVIGFPNNQFPEQNFTVSLDNRDQDLILKNLPGKGWALVNPQTQVSIPSLQQNSAAPPATAPAPEPEKTVKKDDAFSRLMAAVVNDTAVLYNTYASEELLKDTATKNTTRPASPEKDTVEGAALKKDSAGGEKSAAKVAVAKAKATVPAKGKAATAAPKVRKLGERRLASGLQLKFLDLSQSGIKDTVTILIPAEKKENQTAKVTAAAPPTGGEPKDSLKAVSSNPDSGSDSSAGESAANKNPTPSAVQTDCKTPATDYDIDVLRVNILSANSENDKIATAKKAFKSACVTVKQVRALSELFASDKSRYRFYETAYPYVSDREHFGQLQETLTDSTYTEQFKKLTGEQ
jgi:hypothetical protein